MARGARIAAVIMTTGLLMGTTGLSIAAVQQAVSSQLTLSALNTPASNDTGATADVNTLLPGPTKTAALPSIKKILKHASAGSVVAPQSVVAPASVVSAQSAQPTVAQSGHESEHEQEGDD